jgi:hypothetical protein
MPQTKEIVLNVTFPPMASAHDVASVRGPGFWANKICPVAIDAAIVRQATGTALREPEAIALLTSIWLSNPHQW